MTTELTTEEWETGLLKILAQKGDMTLPGNYRGIMLLETSYKIVATVLNKRLQLIEENWRIMKVSVVLALVVDAPMLPLR